jgi:acyl-CoA thioesterase FadM
MMEEAHPIFSIEVELDDSWIEPRYEHVHHGRCFSLLEQARLALLERIGFPNERLLDQGWALVITQVQAAYKREIRKGRIVVSCEEPLVEGRTLRLRQRVWNERGKVAVEARVDSMFMDTRLRRGVDAPEPFRDAFEGWARLTVKTD